MSKSVLTLAAGLFAALPLAAHAADFPVAQTIETAPPVIDAHHWYATFSLGAALPGSVNLTAVETSGLGFPTLTGKATFNTGVVGSIAVGKQLAPNVRGEIEGMLANNTAKSFSGSFANTPPTPSSGTMSGSVTTASLLASAYYDFPGFGGFVPYVGAGFGVANVRANSLTVSGTNGTTTGNSVIAVGRLSAGVNFAVTQSMDINLGYTALLGTNVRFTYNDPTNGAVRKVTASAMGQALTAGLKFRF